MGTICSINHKIIRKNIPEPNLFKDYIYSCNISKNNKDMTVVFGFFCKLRYSDQNIPAPTFITSKDSFPENFNFDDIYNILIKNDNNFLLRFNFKAIYLSDNHNIAIFQILEDNLKLMNISFLEIDNYDYLENINNYQFYNYNLLKNGNLEFSKCTINKVNKNDYTFDYPNNEIKDEFKYALLLNNNKNKLVGTYMKKGCNKGILIIGIINEIQKNQINNKVNSIFNINDNYTEEEMDNFSYEENKIIGNLNSFLIISNDIGKLSQKNSSKINQDSNNNKNNVVHFENSKKDNSNKNNNINILYKDENNSTKIESKDINNQNLEENKKNYLKSQENEIVDNKIFKENNEMKKQSESKNTLNLNNTKNGYGKINIENNSEISKEICLYFEFNNGKELYLDVEESCSFEKVIEKLNEKYLWLKNIEIKDYKINSTSILKNKTVKENKLVDNSTINIIE